MVSLEEFKRLEIKIGEVQEVKPHPQADRLYVLRVKIGEEEKQTVAGIREYYSPEEVKGKKVVVVTNLEPAVIRGVESHGMLLAARDESGISLLIPDKDVVSGAKVS